MVRIPGLHKGKDPKYSRVEFQDDEEEEDEGADALAQPNNNNDTTTTQDGDDDEDDDDDEFDDEARSAHDEETASLTKPKLGVKSTTAQLKTTTKKKKKKISALGLSSASKERRGDDPFLTEDNKSGSVVFMLWCLVMGVVILIVLGLLFFRHQSSVWEQRDQYNQNHDDDYYHASNRNKNENRTESSHELDDDDVPPTFKSNQTPTTTYQPPKPLYTVHYNPMPLHWDPYDLTVHDNTNDDDTAALNRQEDLSSFLPWMTSHHDDNQDAGPDAAYILQPDVVNHTLVFVAEGDLYVTRIAPDREQTQPAFKLTTTVGNVRTPKLHPTLPLVAFTATYTGRREVYVQDWRRNTAAQRVTYWGDSDYGVSGVVGWNNDTTLMIAAMSTAVSLPDTRLYLLTLATTQTTTTPLLITPVPLSQALNGVYHHSDQHDIQNSDCLFFTRFQQSSQTVRYVGGTAESLWLYCDAFNVAVKVSDRADYNGTSKQPTLYQQDGQEYLLFLSDRAWNDETQTWYPTTMNLWAWPLPANSTYNDWYHLASLSDATNTLAWDTIPVPWTQISCQFNGKPLQDYCVDPITSDIVLRVGGDLYLLTSQQIRSGQLTMPTPLKIQVYSDFSETQERLIPLHLPQHLTAVDVFTSSPDTVTALLTARGQAWVSPVMAAKNPTAYQGSGQAIPPRTYRLAPGTWTGGAMRVLMTRNVPLPASTDSKRMAVVLATDPLSPTAEHAFYLVPSHASAPSVFGDFNHWPQPFLGGGNNSELGTIHAGDVVVSPCGRRMAWTDTNGRICVMTLPLYNATDAEARNNTKSTYTVLPNRNELGEPIVGADAELTWSPGGRYLAINHFAKNQFYIISIADCGEPSGDADPIQVGRIAQATPSRFNSKDPYWGTSNADEPIRKHEQKLTQARSGIEVKDNDDTQPAATTLYFLTDRDSTTDTSSPWGTRMPLPHFSTSMVMYALPLFNPTHETMGRFGGATEVFADAWLELDRKIEQIQKEKATLDAAATAADNSTEKENSTSTEQQDDDETSKFPKDLTIDFGPTDLSLARTAYRMVNIPKDNYITILSQTQPDGSFVLVAEDEDGDGVEFKFFEAQSFPADDLDDTSIPVPKLSAFELSTCRGYVSLIRSNGAVQVVPNQFPKLVKAAKEISEGQVDSDQIGLSVWPKLEYMQMYNDAWRMLRDYFYDQQMHQVDWKAVHQRYLPLVERCNKREELDDVLSQLAAELSALHVFVYGGEYNSPFKGDPKTLNLHQPASLGASLERTAEWKGYRISEIAYRDPDYNLLEGSAVYSPLSDQALRPSGQKGLQVGDVIVGVNGESVFRVPDIHMLLRGRAGHSVRLEVLRLASGGRSNESNETVAEATPEPVLVVPLSQSDASNLRYTAWEYKTRQKAKTLATSAGFSLAYIHLRSMSQEDMDDFARSYFEDYDKDAMILDLRHNRGGNIDSWISAFLQRKPWSYFSDRTSTGHAAIGRDMNWNQHYAFRGHLVVLVDEKTSSDGEGISRSISELGLGFLIGKRTWGGGIWLSSDNRLVDGGIATAPEAAVYNEKWGWGMGIEQQGVSPDLEVDNNPRTAFDGVDTQLERAIQKLGEMLAQNPVTVPDPPAQKPDMSLKGEKCNAEP